MSPTIRRAAVSGTAFISACISMTSTMEVSSTTSRSQSSGLSSPRLKPPPLGSTSSIRWMVLASKPVASVMRLAARPVGAHSRISVPFAARTRRMALTMVVLPTPGPPVITSTLDISASLIAATWLSASARPMCFSTQGKALSGSIQGHGNVPLGQPGQPIRNGALRPVQTGQEHTRRLTDLVGDHGALLQLEIKAQCRSGAAAPRAASRPAGSTLASADRSAPHPSPRSAHRKFQREPGSSRSARCQASSRWRRRS